MAKTKEFGGFQRVQKGARTNLSDEAGTVQVTLTLKQNSKYVVGNITRSFSVANAKVSDVAPVIERALFGSAA